MARTGLKGLTAFSLRLFYQEAAWKYYLLNFLHKGLVNILYLIFFTLFLKRQGTEAIPYFYITLNLSMILAQFLLLRSGTIRPLRILRTQTGLLFLAAAAFVPFFGEAPSLFVFSLLTVTMLYNNLTGLMLMEHLAQIYAPHQLKRRLSAIMAAGTLGNIVTGFGVKLLLEWISLRAIYCIGLGMIAAVLFLLPSLRRHGRGEAAESRTEGSSPPAGQSLRAIFSTAFGGNLVVWLFLLGFIVFIARYLLDFGFNLTVDVLYSTEGDFAAFLGVFTSVLDLMVVLVQFFLTSRLLRRWRLGAVLGLLPLGAMLMSLGAAISNLPVLFVFTQFLYVLLFKVFYLPISHITLNPFTEQHRARARIGINFSCSLGTLLVGVFILLFKPMLGPQVIAWGLFCLTGLMFLVVVGVDRAYVRSIVERLASGSAQHRGELVSSLRYTSYAVSRDTVGTLLRDPDPGVRLEALEAVAELQVQDQRNLLLEHLEAETDQRVLAKSFRQLIALEQGADSPALLHFLVHGKDERILASILEALGEVDHSPSLNRLIAEHLDHPNHRVKASAILWALRRSQDEKVLQRALEALVSFIEAEAELLRRTAGVVMAMHPTPFFLSALEQLLDDREQGVRGNALLALARLDTPGALGVLNRYLAKEAQPELHARALILQQRLQSAALLALSQALESMSPSDILALERSFDVDGDRLSARLAAASPEARVALRGYLQEERNQAACSFVLGVVVSGLPPVQKILELVTELPEEAHWSGFFRVLEHFDQEGGGHAGRRFFRAVLDSAWRHSLVLGLCSERGVGGESLIKLSNRRNRLLHALVHLAAAKCSKEENLHQAFDHLSDGDVVERSLARELIETVLSVALGRQLIPLFRYRHQPQRLLERPLEEHAELLATCRGLPIDRLVDEEGHPCS